MLKVNQFEKITNQTTDIYKVYCVDSYKGEKGTIRVKFLSIPEMQNNDEKYFPTLALAQEHFTIVKIQRLERGIGYMNEEIKNLTSRLKNLMYKKDSFQKKIKRLR